jgi:hypothetical protein
MDPSEENPTLVSHFDHHSSPSHQRHPTPAPPAGLKLHFENTNQPLDAYELTQTYLREYAQGVVDGKLMAGKTSSSWSSTTQQPRASTSHSYSDVSLHDSNESRSIRSTRSAQIRGTQPISGPFAADTRPTHRRQDTVSSTDSSIETSSSGSGSQTRSRSRSIPRSNQITHPDLADILSNNPPSAPPPRRSVASLPTAPPSPTLNPNPNPSRPQPSHRHQQQQSAIQPNLTRATSPAPSMVSKASTWGTFISTSTNLTTYSLLDIRNFREGSYPRTATLDGVNTLLSSGSPAVGVNNNATSPGDRTRNGNRIDPRRSSQYSFNSWHGSAASSPPVQMQDQFHYEAENENAMRRDEELLNSSYDRDSIRRRPRVDPQRVTRGRTQPLPALSPSSFSHGEAIINESEARSDPSFMTFGNALGLELSTGPLAISAPTPVVPHRTFLRSFSDEP